MSVLSTIIEAQEFATLPPVAAKVLKLLENDNIDVRDISRVIEADASLTLKLLRVANSPLYASKTQVNSIQQAIVTLGLNRLTNIVLGVSIFSRFLINSQKEAQEIMEKFWWHSACTGMVAKSLAIKINKYFKEAEFIGGLLHDIGKLAMIQFNVEKYKEVINLVWNENIMDFEAEYKIYGVNHMQVGEKIAKLWKLPNELTDVVTYHANPEQSTNSKELVACVRFADILCEIWGADIYEGFQSIVLDDEVSWKILCDSYPELKELDLEIFTFELEEEFTKSSAFLNVISQE